MSETSFTNFYADYIGNSNQMLTHLKNVTHFTRQKIIFHTMQVDSKQYNMDLSDLSGEAYNFGSYIVFYRNEIAFIITRGGHVFIEKPSSSRISELARLEHYRLPTEYEQIETYITDDYIKHPTGMIALRDVHDEFYELQYNGQYREALEYAMNVFGVSI